MLFGFMVAFISALIFFALLVRTAFKGVPYTCSRLYCGAICASFIMSVIGMLWFVCAFINFIGSLIF